MHAGAWYYSTDHEQLCQVLEVQTLWGSTTCRIWLQESNSLTWVAAERLTPIEVLDDCSADHIVYVASAARVADALHQNLLLAPIESSVIPLPHQIRALSRAIAGDRVRYLLADEVGLGKTIEAGLILRELKLRGLVRRTLVIAPKGLVQQWVSEMRFHFGETFQLVLADDLRTLQRISETDSHGRASSGDPWHMFSQIVVPMDSVKPLERRKGWTASQIQEYNRERFEDLLAAGWDLIIVDEAHRLGGSTEQVARYKLGKGLANAAPYLLLLSATPHQGKTDSFHRLVSLLDEMAFPDVDSVSRERVQPYVIRTEKRKAIDAEGKPLFTPRNTQLVSIAWQDRHSAQRELYEAVTDYVREGYNLALREKRNYIGFLMILMQRMVTSSTSAIRSALGKRLEVLRSDTQEIGSTERSELRMLDAESIYDLDGQEQAEILLRSKLKAFRNEQAEVQLLLDAAIRCEQSANDAKAEALLEWIYRLQAEEGDPDLKILVFTEFLSTQDMLFRFLSERGFSVVCLNGTMDLDTRTRVQQEFADHARILVSTDAGGEGLNLQFCHVVINYDMPWNPMQLEQRIGRVDRIGQRHSVRAINFVLEDSIEHRVQEVLEEKLEIIFREFGIDKTGDVLDSAQAGALFDDMYIKAILAPESLTESIEQAVSIVREQAQEARDTASVLHQMNPLIPKQHSSCWYILFPTG
jgi:SNF2 family DNA or RNA helicase